MDRKAARSGDDVAERLGEADVFSGIVERCATLRPVTHRGEAARLAVEWPGA